MAKEYIETKYFLDTGNEVIEISRRMFTLYKASGKVIKTNGTRIIVSEEQNEQEGKA